MDDDHIIDYAEARFEIRPYPTYGHMMQIDALVRRLGYKFPFSRKQYSLEDVQEMLRSEGPSAFLKYSRLQEDISPKAPFKDAKTLVEQRLQRLGPTRDLVIIDPYLFPGNPQLGVDEYTDFLTSLISSLLEPDAVVKCVVNARTDATVVRLTRTKLEAKVPGVSLEKHQTDEFHDRFWIADRNRGTVVGTSFNGLGGKLFFIDALKPGDVASISEELVKMGI